MTLTISVKLQSFPQNRMTISTMQRCVLAGAARSSTAVRSAQSTKGRPQCVVNGIRSVTNTPTYARNTSNAAAATWATSSHKTSPSVHTAALLATAAASAVALTLNSTPQSTPTSCEVVMLGPTKEPATGILFPRLCNGLTFVGCGVRIKYHFVKVYAVATYVDPIAMNYLKSRSSDEIEKALLDPTHPRTIRIVMNRSLSMQKYTAAIVEALEPRMNGKDLDKLEEFKKFNAPGTDLVEGSVMEMTIRGDTVLCKSAAGNVDAIHSEVFCKALCDVYYGKEAVSPTHKEMVMEGIKKGV